MALKDWRKMATDENYWFRWRKSNGKEVEVYQVRGNRRWHINITGKSRKFFKTKAQALTYAKSYMGKN